MKRIIACAASLALLSACAQEAEDATDAAAAEETAAPAADTMESYVGAWNVTYADGATGVTTNNADGSYETVMADGTTSFGLWSFGEEQSCWQPEEAEEARCYTVSPPDENGTRVLTMADGTSITVSPAEAE